MVRDRSRRVILFAGVALALSVLARPAFASGAPFCDDRGASATADPPPLVAPGETVSWARTCPYGADDAAYYASIARARGRATRTLSAADAALFPRAAEAPAPPDDRLVPVLGEHAVGREVRSRVDRPPRV